ncbi:PLC-like phosphodiesterase [Lophiotrema nucula]|uniref:PLC-like phosphodiesterase n=1 Tax=Lophiotrema nucula TaxID=690887 RepID=A0A6A5Z1P0_9PLEO|nr:PLC-like phosphodiesterase [Lophiotrema nucula]
MQLFIFLCISIAALVGWTNAAPTSSQRACNNSPSLCTKPYDMVTYLGAHDSPFLRDATTGYSSFGNQLFSTTTQLDAGVRLLSGQVHRKDGQLHMCHTSCAMFDAGPLRDWLEEVKRWMDANPTDIVTLILVNSDNVSAKEFADVYTAADIARFAYVPLSLDAPPPPSNETVRTWPTLNEMIDKNQRLVNFVAPLKPDAGVAPFLMDQWTFTWENTYQVTSPDSFNCAPDRPSNTSSIKAYQDSGRLFMMNHFLYWQQAFGIQVPDIRNINATNSWDGPGALGQHFMRCANELQRMPNYVLVDFFNVGPATNVIDIFNGVKEPIGRFGITATVVGGGAGVQANANGGRSWGASMIRTGTAAMVAGMLGVWM